MIAETLCDHVKVELSETASNAVEGDTVPEESSTDAAPEPKKFAPVVIDSANGKVERLPKLNLSSIDDVRLEMSKVYRDMRSGRIDSQLGSRLVYVLGEIAKMYRLGEMAARIEAVERALAGRSRP